MPFWPFGVCGFAGPLLTWFLSRWMPLHVAAGVVAFVGFAAAFWVFQRLSVPVQQPLGLSLTASLIPGLAAGLSVGVLTFLFPWRR